MLEFLNLERGVLRSADGVIVGSVENIEEVDATLFPFEGDFFPEDGLTEALAAILIDLWEIMECGALSLFDAAEARVEESNLIFETTDEEVFAVTSLALNNERSRVIFRFGAM